MSSPKVFIGDPVVVLPPLLKKLPIHRRTEYLKEGLIAMTTVPFSIRLDADIKNKLEQEAKSVDRSASYVAIKAIKRYLIAREEKREIIDEAVKRADEGTFISQKAVNYWVDSWGSDEELPKPKADISKNS